MKMIIIYPWMLKKFKGLELFIFAVIFSFHSYKKKTILKLNTWLELLSCSRSQFYESIKKLINKNVIEGSILDGLSLVDNVIHISNAVDAYISESWEDLISDIDD